MGFSLALLCVSAVIASSSCFAIQNLEPLCPPPEIIDPCTCSNDDDAVTAICTNISDKATIRNVFSNNQDWYLDAVHIDQCSLEYIPSSILENATFDTLNVSSSTLVSLFDASPVKSTETAIYLVDVKILRGILWEVFSNSNLVVLGTKNVEISTFGNSFKEHMPQEVRFLWFRDAKTASITDQAFQRLVNLEILTLTGGSLKKIHRDMFPRPWKIKFLDLSRQKIAALPKDFFEDLPNLYSIELQNNFFTTISEEVFTKNSTEYYFTGNAINCVCGVKWLPTPRKPSDSEFVGTCAEPVSMKGRELESLTEEDFRYCK